MKIMYHYDTGAGKKIVPIGYFTRSFSCYIINYKIKIEKIQQ
jgi:hypothetical protein